MWYFISSDFIQLHRYDKIQWRNFAITHESYAQLQCVHKTIMNNTVSSLQFTVCNLSFLTHCYKTSVCWKLFPSILKKKCLASLYHKMSPVWLFNNETYRKFMEFNTYNFTWKTSTKNSFEVSFFTRITSLVDSFDGNAFIFRMRTTLLLYHTFFSFFVCFRSEVIHYWNRCDPVIWNLIATLLLVSPSRSVKRIFEPIHKSADNTNLFTTFNPVFTAFNELVFIETSFFYWFALRMWV